MRRGLLLIFAPIFTGEVLASRSSFHTYRIVQISGASSIDLSPTDAYVDGTMVSAKGWTALAAFIRECLKVLGTEILHS